MLSKKTAATYCIRLTCLLTACLLPTAQASVRIFTSEYYESRAINCEYPVKLTHDRSAWQGATRPIAFGRHRMSIAAGSGGRTILLSRVRPGPDHNGYRFRAGPGGRHQQTLSLQAIQCIGDVLEDEGIRLERMQTVRRGRRPQAYFLEFSGNAYDILKQFTVLESEYWLPERR